ncbi:uncharacterized protein LOC122919803 [Bufo gargarizans]|uniref:uncharacterized protein LOC122919803 n=1 Tax=Bufo gargarizans TaxID=30331 RepID=UPI001CF3C156|nr:uncharacterized protein LOC122919803 [Bufo gargarizans]
MASLRLPRLCCPERDAGTDLVLGAELYHAVCSGSALLGLLGLAICYSCSNRRKSQATRMGWRVLLASALVTTGFSSGDAPSEGVKLHTDHTGSPCSLRVVVQPAEVISDPLRLLLFLGMLLDTDAAQIRLPPDKRLALHRSMRVLLDCRLLSILLCMRMLGKMVACFEAIPFAQFRSRTFLAILSSWDKSSKSLDYPIRLSPRVVTDFHIKEEIVRPSPHAKEKELHHLDVVRALKIYLAASAPFRWLLLHSTLWLLSSDFLSSQSWLSYITCVFISTWIHYFCSVLFWAFFCYFLEIDQLFKRNPSERFGVLYSFLCWGASSLVCLHGLLMLAIPSVSQNRCDSKHGLILFHDVLLYIPLLLALFGSPFLLRRALAGVPAVLRMQCGVYTCCERYKKHSLRRRLFQISGTFIACWLGNVLCDFLLLLTEVSETSEPPRQLQVAAVMVFVIMGILNPMFCCVHSLAFFGWRSSDACVTQSRVAAEAPSGTSLDREDTALVEAGNLLLRPKSVHAMRILSFQNILQSVDSCSSMEFTCSAMEINAVRLLGKKDPPAPAQIGSMF